MDWYEAQRYIAMHAPNQSYSLNYRSGESYYLPELTSYCSQLDGDTVLDIGPGWGTTAVYLANHLWDVSVLDFVDQGEFIAAEVLRNFNIKYYRCDIEHGRIGGTFDLVICTMVIHHLKHRADLALRNIASLMGGPLITAVLDRNQYPELQPVFNHWRDVPVLGDPVPGINMVMYDEEMFRDLLSSVFPTVRVWTGRKVIWGECKI